MRCFANFFFSSQDATSVVFVFKFTVETPEEVTELNLRLVLFGVFLSSGLGTGYIVQLDSSIVDRPGYFTNP